LRQTYPGYALAYRSAILESLGGRCLQDAYDRTRDKKVIVITLLESSIILAVELSLLGHPAREAVARVIATSSKPPTFYWNYRTAAPPSGSSARRIWVRGSSYPKTEQKPEMRVPAGR
jgi:hypothetical protein